MKKKATVRAFTNAAGEPCVSIRAAAKLLGVSPERVRQYIALNRLPAEPAPGGIPLTLIPIAAVKAFKRQATGRPKNGEGAVASKVR